MIKIYKYFFQTAKSPTLSNRAFLIRSLAMSYSHMGTPTLPSALLRFTSEFGMGSGGTTVLLSLDKNVINQVINSINYQSWNADTNKNNLIQFIIVRDVHGCTSVERSHGWRVQRMFYHLMSVFYNPSLYLISKTT